MSVLRACAIVHITDRRGWYLFLAQEEHGELRLGEATCEGPFRSEEEAESYLFHFYSNPGGLWSPTMTYDQLSPEMRKLLDNLQKPKWRGGW